MNRIKIRPATEKDLSRIYQIERRSYPPQLQATHEILKYRLRTFGIWVAEYNGIVRGFFTCIPVYMAIPKINLKKLISHRKPIYKPWFESYKKGGRFNTLFITSTAVESKYQNRGIGTALIKYSLKLAKKLKLAYRASALRCEYGKFYRKTRRPISDYIKEVQAGKIRDRFLHPYVKIGFILSKALKDYEPNKGSLNYNIFSYKKIKDIK